MQSAAAKPSGKTHRRSRTGCYTCRLRRKKCDEAKPTCRACKHLGLSCEYKRPCWWGDGEQRKLQKDTIKIIIKRTKLSEKAGQRSPSSADSPPELSRSLPTSDTLSDTLARARSLSVESGYTLYDPEHEGVILDNHGNFIHPALYNAHHYQGAHHLHQQRHQQYQQHRNQQQFHGNHFNPGMQYDFNGFLHQKETFVNGFPISTPRRSSSASTFSRRGSLAEQFIPALNSIVAPSEETASSRFDYQHYATPPPPPVALPFIPVEGSDRALLDHFLQEVQQLILPILNLHGNARHDVILPALANNECYRHCCLSIAALHIKAVRNLTPEQLEIVDQDITRHRYKTVSGLCEALARDSDHLEILEATLGMTLFQCSVGSPADALPDIPWHQHFQAALELVNKMDLCRHLQPLSRATSLTHSLNMTLTAWIDILGATMRGCAPQFADAYREKHLSNGYSGLRELMGCDDRVMYLISEIACLEALKDQSMLSDMDLCEHVKSLAHQIDMTEPSPETIVPPIIQSGHVDPRALTATMTTAFRYAARIYLCSLVPGFDRDQVQVKQLLEKLKACLELIPSGPEGFDRSLVWVYLIGGSVASGDQGFREFLMERCQRLAKGAENGSFGRMVKVLNEVWEVQDGGVECHWREIMKSRRWEDLLV